MAKLWLTFLPLASPASAATAHRNVIIGTENGAIVGVRADRFQEQTAQIRAMESGNATDPNNMPFAPNRNGYVVNGNNYIANTYPTSANPPVANPPVTHPPVADPYASCGVYGYPPSTAMPPTETFPGPYAPAFNPYGMQTGNNIALAPGQRSNISAGTWAEHATQAPYQLGAGATAFHTGTSIGNFGQYQNSFPYGELAQNHGLPYGGYGQNNIGVSHRLHEQQGQQYSGILPEGYRQQHHNALPGVYGQQYDRIPSENYAHYRNNALFETFVQPHTGIPYREYGQSPMGLPSGAYEQPPQGVNGFSNETSLPFPNALAPMLAAPNPSVPSEDMVANFSGYSTSLNDLRSPECPCGPEKGYDASEQQENQPNSTPRSQPADATSASIGTVGSPAGQSNSSRGSRPCACGPGCQCVFCRKHPYNENSLNRAQDLRQIWEEDFASNNPPQPSCGDNSATPTQDGSANVLEDGRVTNEALNSDPLQQQENRAPDGYDLVEYLFDENGILTCPKGTETCRCIQSCDCHGCIHHNGHMDEPAQRPSFSWSRNQNTSLTAVQKRHFAKARNRSMHNTQHPVSIDFSVFEDGRKQNHSRGQVIHNIRHSIHKPLGSQMTLKEYDSLLPKVKQLKSIRPRRRKQIPKAISPLKYTNQPYTHLHRPKKPSPVTNLRRPDSVPLSQAKASNVEHGPRAKRARSPALDPIEKKRHELLSRPDWIGLEESKPVNMQFQDSQDRDLIGKRRRLTDNGERIMAQDYNPRPVPGPFEKLKKLHAPSNRYSSPERISVRIGSAGFRRKRRKEYRHSKSEKQRSVASDEMLSGAEEASGSPEHVNYVQFQNGVDVKNNGSEDMLLDGELEQQMSTHESSLSVPSPARPVPQQESFFPLEKQSISDPKPEHVRSGCRPSSPYTISSGSFSDTSDDYETAEFPIRHYREQLQRPLKQSPSPLPQPRFSRPSLSSDAFPAELLRTSSPSRPERDSLESNQSSGLSQQRSAVIDDTESTVAAEKNPTTNKASNYAPNECYTEREEKAKNKLFDLAISRELHELQNHGSTELNIAEGQVNGGIQPSSPSLLPKSALKIDNQEPRTDPETRSVAPHTDQEVPQSNDANPKSAQAFLANTPNSPGQENASNNTKHPDPPRPEAEQRSREDEERIWRQFIFGSDGIDHDWSFETSTKSKPSQRKATTATALHESKSEFPELAMRAEPARQVRGGGRSPESDTGRDDGLGGLEAEVEEEVTMEASMIAHASSSSVAAAAAADGDPHGAGRLLTGSRANAADSMVVPVSDPSSERRAEPKVLFRRPRRYEGEPARVMRNVRIGDTVIGEEMEEEGEGEDGLVEDIED
ncbi:MAG: hypothetical protein Q9167_003369 [Letrouitia subvulpina]